MQQIQIQIQIQQIHNQIQSERKYIWQLRACSGPMPGSRTNTNTNTTNTEPNTIRKKVYLADTS